MTLRSSFVNSVRLAKPPPNASWQTQSESQSGIALIFSYTSSQPLTAVAIRFSVLLGRAKTGQVCGSIRRRRILASVLLPDDCSPFKTRTG